MVRVISEKLFSPPRSRHSSGEAVDKELAARAVEALSSLNSRRLEFSDYESSSDSHWDSEVDFDGDCPDNSTSEGQAKGDGNGRGTVSFGVDLFSHRDQLCGRLPASSVHAASVCAFVFRSSARALQLVRSLVHFSFYACILSRGGKTVQAGWDSSQRPRTAAAQGFLLSVS